MKRRQEGVMGLHAAAVQRRLAGAKSDDSGAQIGHIGDVNWAEYGGGPVYCRTPEGQTDIWGGDCFVEYVEPPEGDFDSHGAIWTVYRVDLDPSVPNWGDLEAAAQTSGQDPEELRAAFESTDPMERAFAYETWAGHYGWHEFDQYPLTLTCAEMNERYDADIDCYGAIQSEIEEEVERMADESSAQAWSTPGDQMLIDLEDEGYDPKTVVNIADFGDAVAVNGDLTDETVVEIMTQLEANGYEETSFGGRIPAEEGYAYGEHVIDAVAKRLKLPREHVEAAAKALDWWQEEIPRSTSGDGSVWAKKKAGAEERRRPRRPR